MSNFKTFHTQTKVHGSYLIREAKGNTVAPLLVGFHGYGETAEDHLQMLLQIPGIDNWTVCAIQALHSFYNSKGFAGYSWMTSLDRELRIKENVEYVNAIIKEIKNTHAVNDTIVFHGFSQGTAMACRAALLSKFDAAGVILLGGDIPPEIDNLKKMKCVLLARGRKDKFYSSSHWKNDVAKSKIAGIESHFCEFDGGHGGHVDYYKTVGKFLKYYISK